MVKGEMGQLMTKKMIKIEKNAWISNKHFEDVQISVKTVLRDIVRVKVIKGEVLKSLRWLN